VPKLLKNRASGTLELVLSANDSNNQKGFKTLA
jgi:hypothetical protein